MKALLTLLILSALAACGAETPVPEAQADHRPRRIVSLDYCADQYVLKFADRQDILALSPYAGESFSYMREQAVGLRSVQPHAENILALRPDLVVRSFGGGPNMAAFLEQAGVSVVQLGYPASLADVREEVTRLSAALGNAQAGREVVQHMDERLARIGSDARARTALYLTPSGVTTGPDTLVNEMIEAAGFRNFQRRKGWNPLPLERLAYRRPDIVAAASFGEGANKVDNWSAARHPIARAQLRDRPVVSMSGAWTSCGGWFLLDAVEALAKAPAAAMADAGPAAGRGGGS
jgi:iron complex transport system substrate-binding protein|tara:strand:- start:1791 stop:2666 length:876 start_codon:yes stop_codon:yes gene_type:complete